MNKQIQAFKYRIYPTSEQSFVLRSWIGQIRKIWNLFLEEEKKEYIINKQFIFRFDLQNQLPLLKKQYPWLSAPAHAFQAIAFQMDQSLKNCFKSGFGFPLFKKKGKNEAGIKINQSHESIYLTDKHIKIPKLGLVKIRKHRNMKGKLISVTITRDVNHWYVSCVCEIGNIPEPLPFREETSLGIDLGLKNLIVTSDAEVIDNPNFLRKSEKQIIKAHRNYSRKKKGSKNKEKSRINLAKQHRKIKNQRKDYLHKISCAIAKTNDHVFAEDLAVKNLEKNHCLAKSVADVGWAMLINFISYKLSWKGGSLRKINRFYPSSQICSNCGERKPMPLQERTYICDKCGLKIDRDYNAALNILHIGQEMPEETKKSEIFSLKPVETEDVNRSLKQEAVMALA